MIPALGPTRAADLQRAMTAHMCHTARALAAKEDVSVEIRFDGTNSRRMRRWLGRLPKYRKQGPGDLGERLQRAFRAAFAEGASRVVVIGTDCPSLKVDTLERAFAALDQADVVIGPATDGGYTLIGLRRLCPKLFGDIAWGTDAVLARTRRIAEEEALRTVLLPELDDVDRPADLPVWEHHRQTSSRLAVIIPTLNEAEHLERTLKSVVAGSPAEVVVSDGGSTDSTCEIAAALGTKIVRGARGRAAQMNAGAAGSSAAQLLFLHADTTLPEGYRERIAEALGRPDVAGGTFGFAIREPVPFRRVLEGLVSLRCWLLKTPFGDQGLFLRREMFEAIGGYPDWPLLEDVEVVRRLKRWGRLLMDRAPALTSGRRWTERGVWRPFWMNQRIMLGHYRGQPPEQLAEFYHRPDGSRDV
jgi:rSAM/selenodomain-associated transferase 2/rSAM/selenodomain-associated transferase 1